MLGCIILTVTATVASWIPALTDFNSPYAKGTRIAYGLVILALLVGSTIASAVLLYRWWSCLPPGWRQTTPGKAVGFSFIPGLCFYWWFVAIGGRASDLNNFMDSHGIGGECRAPIGLAYTYVALTLVSFIACWIPGLADLIGLVSVVLYLALAVKMTRACRHVLAGHIHM